MGDCADTGSRGPAGRQLSAQFWRVFSTRQTEDFEVAKRLFVLASASGSLVQSTMNLSALFSLIFYIYYSINSTKNQISTVSSSLWGRYIIDGDVVAAFFTNVERRFTIAEEAQYAQGAFQLIDVLSALRNGVL